MEYIGGQMSAWRRLPDGSEFRIENITWGREHRSPRREFVRRSEQQETLVFWLHRKAAQGCFVGKSLWATAIDLHGQDPRVVCRTNGSFAGAPRAEGFEAWELADPIRRGERFTVRFTLPKGLNRHREAQFHHCAEFMLPNTPEWIDGLIRNAREYDASPQRLIDDLTMAIADHDVEQVRHLVRSGARLPGTSRFGYNELHFAILRDGIDLAKYLIESGADVNEPTTSGQTPLMLATERGQEDLVRLLREKAAG